MAENILALCSGVGTLELGLKLAVPDARTVCYVEREIYAVAVLAKRMQEGDLDDAPVWTDITTFDGTAWRGCVDILAAGYPCQPFSAAGKKKGMEDERWVWKDIARIVDEVKPTTCFFENVPGHLRLGFEQVVYDLSDMGFRVKAGLFTAQEIGAPQRRERLFIVAHSRERDRRGSINEKNTRGTDTEESPPHAERPSTSYMEHAESDKNERRCFRSGERKQKITHRKSSEIALFPPPVNGDWEGVDDAFKPEISRMADGNSCWVDRVRGIGNAVVPLVAAYAWETLRDKEMRE